MLTEIPAAGVSKRCCFCRLIAATKVEFALFRYQGSCLDVCCHVGAAAMVLPMLPLPGWLPKFPLPEL